MPSNKFDWTKRVKAVEREHNAIRFAIDYLLHDAQQNPGALGRVVRVRDVLESSERLEGTYIIRLFAEFESSLRAFWNASRGTGPPSRTRDLLDGIGARRKIPHDRIDNAHAVREFRNALVHEREDNADAIPIAEARSHLCYFLSFLPKSWSWKSGFADASPAMAAVTWLTR